ncbi:hypothetical protein [uncultured Pseudonocardia sp.]|uniref:hypothetical protein n=1 Tax=uncultured Pseudonocardia sp. TaxID=211455 RepID=UPI00263304FB|nr:hypothetical protein [uncultured Pseudonocardia sp.]
MPGDRSEADDEPGLRYTGAVVLGLSADGIGLGLTIGWTSGLLAGSRSGRWPTDAAPRGRGAARRAHRGRIGGFVLVGAAPGLVAFVLVCCVYACAQTGSGPRGRPCSRRRCRPPNARRCGRIQATADAGLGAALGGWHWRSTPPPPTSRRWRSTPPGSWSPPHENECALIMNADAERALGTTAR